MFFYSTTSYYPCVTFDSFVLEDSLEIVGEGKSLSVVFFLLEVVLEQDKGIEGRFELGYHFG